MSLIVRHLGLCAYADALALQEQLLARRSAGADYLLVLEHEPVYTLGRGADGADLCGADRLLNVPVYRVSRGGGVTFHGPGQLVCYPIIGLRESRRDVHRYVSDLEAVLMSVCADFGIAAARRSGTPGVWVGAAKIASVGIGIRRWITFHGVALNVTTDLSYFTRIVPCRMPDIRMTSMARELQRAPAMDAVRASFVRHFEATFGYVRPAAKAEAAP
jgi:lipoate-protein ligase B